MKSRLTTFIILNLLFLIPISACQNDRPQEKTTNVIFLIDHSLSTVSARQLYSESFGKVADTLKMGDHLSVWKITEHSEMEPSPIIDADFSAKGLSPNEFFKKQMEGQIRQTIDQAKHKVKDLLLAEKRFARKTSIINSLQIAERVFKKYPRNENLIVIFSDMIEDSRYNFEKMELSDDRISKIIDQEKKQNRLPDLAGARVVVAGAGITNRMKQEQFNQIRRFWQAYFQASGATCAKEDYGSAIIGFK